MVGNILAARITFPRITSWRCSTCRITSTREIQHGFRRDTPLGKWLLENAAVTEEGLRAMKLFPLVRRDSDSTLLYLPVAARGMKLGQIKALMEDLPVFLPQMAEQVHRKEKRKDEDHRDVDDVAEAQHGVPVSLQRVAAPGKERVPEAVLQDGENDEAGKPHPPDARRYGDEVTQMGMNPLTRMVTPPRYWKKRSVQARSRWSSSRNLPHRDTNGLPPNLPIA